MSLALWSLVKQIYFLTNACNSKVESQSEEFLSQEMNTSNDANDSGEGGLWSLNKQVEYIGFRSSVHNISGDGTLYSVSEGMSINSHSTAC